MSERYEIVDLPNTFARLYGPGDEWWQMLVDPVHGADEYALVIGAPGATALVIIGSLEKLFAWLAGMRGEVQNALARNARKHIESLRF